MPLPEEYRKNVFMFLGALVVPFLTIIILYFDYNLFQPHVSTCVWAIILSLILRKLKLKIVSFLQVIGKTPKIYKLLISIAIWVNYLLSIVRIIQVWSLLSIQQRFIYIVIEIILGIVLLLPILLSYESLATLLTLLITLLASVVALILIVRTCYQESIIATNLVGDFIESNKQFFVNAFLQNSTITSVNGTADVVHAAGVKSAATEAASNIWNTAHEYCTVVVSQGMNQYHTLKHITYLPFSTVFGNKGDLGSQNSTDVLIMSSTLCKTNIGYLQENLAQLALATVNWFGSNIGWFGNLTQQAFASAVGFLNNLSDFTFSLILFFTFLYYFLQYDKDFIEYFSKLSPLPEEESLLITRSLNTKILKTFYYAVFLAAFRFCITVFSFWFVGFDVKWIFGFLSAFFSLIPILSSWIIWIPGTVLLVARDGIWSHYWYIFMLIHLSGYLVDNILYTNFFKDQNPTLLGVSIILGVYVYGWRGLLVGPITIGLTLTLLDIYGKYIDEATDHHESPTELTEGEGQDETPVGIGGSSLGPSRPDIISSIKKRHERSPSTLDVWKGIINYVSPLSRHNSERFDFSSPKKVQ